MADDFTDPGWWPTPPPDPPKHISTATIVLGTIVPIAVVAMLVLALVTHKSHSANTSGRSLAAFQSCLGEQGVMTSSAESNDALLRQAAIACKSHVPPLARGVDEAKAVQQELDDCMRAAQSKLRRTVVPIGPFAGPPSRRAYENASATCRAESMVASGGADQGGVGGSSGSVA
jgi:hypothetical protein